MVRQMLGAVNEFVAASARERLAHGRAKALQDAACDPEGARSCKGDPKVGGPAAILEQDPELAKAMQIYAEMPEKTRPTYGQIAKDLRKQNKKWSVRKKGKKKNKRAMGSKTDLLLLGASPCAKEGQEAAKGKSDIPEKKHPLPKANKHQQKGNLGEGAASRGRYERQD